jgi:hypothetical protein
MYPNKKEAVSYYETASFFNFIFVINVNYSIFVRMLNSIYLLNLSTILNA